MKIESAENNSETLLVLQGGGSLGSYEYGVYKTLARHGIDFDMISGTSIGAVNAAIIAGTNENNPAKALEDFWLELSEKISLPWITDGMESYMSTVSATLCGNPKVATPINGVNPWLFAASEPFLYDNKPLKDTLSRYVDFDKINSKQNPRLVITSVDIQSGSPVIFDSKEIKIDIEHVIASTGYPFYGISWTKKDERYLWDGSILSNTPLREAIDASPIHDKMVYIVDLFPKMQMDLPKNMAESWHRARDIMHADKTEHSMRISKVIYRQLDLLKKLHFILERATLDEKLESEFLKTRSEYEKLVSHRGAIIKDIIRIEKKEKTHSLFEDADFSESKIKYLILQGEQDAENVLAEKNHK